MPNLSQETIRKMREVIAAVKANAQFYNQDRFPIPDDCGTTCCAAGFAVWINIPKGKYKDYAKNLDGGSEWAVMAREVLGLDSSMYLFSTHNAWPKKFQKLYSKAKTPKERSGALEACWEHFIKKDGDPYHYETTDEVPF